MTLAAIPWLSISINLLLVVFVIVCVLMTFIILMQRPKQEGLGAAFGGGVTDQVFGARTTNVLQRGTVYLGSMFFILSLTLAVLIGHQNKKNPLLQKKSPPPVEQKQQKPEAEITPKSLSTELPAQNDKPASTPAAPPASTPATPPASTPATPPASTPATPAEKSDKP